MHQAPESLSVPPGHHRPAPPVHGQAHGHLGLRPAGCGHDRPGSGGQVGDGGVPPTAGAPQRGPGSPSLTHPQPVLDVEGHAASGGPGIQASAAPGRGLEDQRCGAPRCGRTGRGWGRHAHRAMTTAPPRSEPPLWLRAAGRRAAGGLGSLVAAHTTPEEMRYPHRAHPHVSALHCPPARPHLTPATSPLPRPQTSPPTPVITTLGGGHVEAGPQVSVQPSVQGEGRI